MEAFKNVVDSLPSGDKLTVEQQNTILNVVKSTAQSKIIENDLVTKLIDKLGSLTTTTTDLDQLNSYLKALKEVKSQNFRLYQRDQNTNTTKRFLSVTETGYRDREKKLKEQESGAIHSYLSSNLDSKRGDLELEIEFENVKGRAQIVKDIVDKHIQSLNLAGSNESTIEIQATIGSDVLPNRDEENIVEFIATSSIISTAANASQILGGRNYEVTIFDSSKNKRTIKDLTGDCPILVQIPVEKTGDPKTEIPKTLLNCTYYDETSNKYASTGLKLLKIDETEKNYIINCCTNHLTSFAAIQIEANTIGKTTGSPRLLAASAVFILSLILSVLI